ncbi:DUF4304 domain-containing protein [Intrasporangium calvum]|uniref:DUF4304 domain-containing protein n=1 Tax=Intrasporangium calvum TaxID=53358 RepID=UPI003B5888FE
MDVDAPGRLRAALRDVVAPVLKSAGYRRSGQTWRRLNSLGDTSIVNVQMSAWNSAETARVYVNLAVVPAPWWDWTRLDLGIPDGKAPLEQHGLYRDRLEPLETERARPDSWTCSDEESAQEAVKDLVGRLTEHGLPLLDRLLDRDRMVEAVRRSDLGHLKSFPAVRHLALVVMLSEVGGAEFDHACDELGRGGDVPAFQERARRAIAWARERAAR